MSLLAPSNRLPTLQAVQEIINEGAQELNNERQYRNEAQAQLQELVRFCSNLMEENTQLWQSCRNLTEENAQLRQNFPQNQLKDQYAQLWQTCRTLSAENAQLRQQFLQSPQQAQDLPARQAAMRTSLPQKAAPKDFLSEARRMEPQLLQLVNPTFSLPSSGQPCNPALQLPGEDDDVIAKFLFHAQETRTGVMVSACSALGAEAVRLSERKVRSAERLTEARIQARLAEVAVQTSMMNEKSAEEAEERFRQGSAEIVAECTSSGLESGIRS